jgi:hypothetical protein
MNLRHLWVATFVACIALLPAVTAWALPGTVRLKNGGWVEGEILEMLPGERVSVRGADGTTRTIPWAEVERVDQGQPAPAAAAPAAAAPAALPAPSEAPTAAAPEIASEPAAPAKRSTVLALNDPNTHRIVLISGDTKIYLLGLPRSDASSVALRFERYVRQPELADCKELGVTIDGAASSYPLQHTTAADGTGLREIVQAQATLELAEQMAKAKDIRFDLCLKPRPLSFVSHHAPIMRFVAEFKSLIGKPPIAFTPRRGGQNFERNPTGYGYAGESLSDLERQRAEIGIGGPIALTAAGGVIALTGVSFLLTGLVLNDVETDNICDPSDPDFGESYCEGSEVTNDIATAYIVVGLIGVVLGGVGLAVGIPTLSSRIKERRELGLRIKELRGSSRSLMRQANDGPRLARTAPFVNVHF